VEPHEPELFALAQQPEPECIPDLIPDPFHDFGPDPTSNKMTIVKKFINEMTTFWATSVAGPDPNPDPDPPNPHVFGPPESGSTSQRYRSGSGSFSGSGSGSFYHQAIIVRKTLIPIFL
jgi:hypothetical protein